MTRLGSLLNSPLAVLASRLVVAALGLVSAPLIAHALGPVGRGQTAAALAAFFLVPIVLALGMPYEARRRVLADGSMAAVRTARALAVLAVVPAALLALVLTSTVLSSFSPADRIAAFAGVTLAPLMISWMIDTGVLVAQRRLGAVALLQCAQPLVFVAAIATLAAAGQLTVASVLWSSIAGSAVTTVLGAALNRASLRGDRVAVRDFVRGSITFWGAQAADAAYRRLDQVVMLPVLGAVQAGLYSVAVTIGTLPVFLAQAMASPVFADATEASPERRHVVAGEVIRASLVVAIAAAAALALVSPALVAVLFGADFAPAMPAVFVAIAGSVFLVVGVSVAELVSARNLGLRLTLAQVGGLVVVLALLLLLGPTGGALGAAIANASGIATTLVALLVIVRVPWSELRPRPSDVPLALRRLVRRGGAAG